MLGVRQARCRARYLGQSVLKSVVITGASTGIGRACALHLARRGWNVFAGVRKETDAESLKAEETRVTPLLLDVTDQNAIEAARKTVQEEVGVGLDGLVNNAGIGVGGPVEFITLDEWRNQFEVNVFGLIAMTQAFLPALRASKGRIVNIGSVAGRAPSLPAAAPYCSSKWAVEAITDSLRIELKPSGVHVAVIEPGNIATEIWDKTDSSLERFPPEAHELYGGLIAAGREVTELAGRTGIPAEKVAQVIEHALTARRPRYRYLVGIDARVRTYVEGNLPHRWRDRLFLRLGEKGLPAFLKK